MGFFVVIVAGLAAMFIVMALSEIAKEMRAIRSVFETQYQLERVPVKSENAYKRKGVEL